MARRTAALLVALTATGACVDPQPSSPSPADLADIDLSVDHTITVDEDGFHPAELEVVGGDVIRLVNEGTGQHSFTSDERFDTGRMEPGEDTTLVLTDPGTVAYRDLEAPTHEGALTITEAPPAG